MTAADRNFRLWLLLVWLGWASTLVGLSWPSIAAFRLPEADDAMRLIEVRDWLAGQSWFDVSQHRMNQPWGLSMHWSRLLDVPLGAIISALRPWAGQRAAETAAAVIVPMVTLGACMALVATLARRRWGAPPALLAAAFCPMSAAAWYAMRPLRIDHHGWQVVAGLGLAAALTGRRSVRNAAIAGLCAAAWTHISLEGLVVTAAAAGWLALRWIVDPAAERARLPAFLGTLTAGSAALFLIVHGVATVGRTYCDAVSPIHVTLFAGAAAGTMLAHLLLGRPTICAAPQDFTSYRPDPQRARRRARMSLLLRGIALAVTALGCGMLYRLGAPQCAGGPFAALDPFVYRLWYANMNEGMPIWRAGIDVALLWGSFPMIGLVGALIDWRTSQDAIIRAAALDYLALLVAATLTGFLVMRAGAFSNMLAIPGAIGLTTVAMARTRRLAPALRLPLRAGALLLLSPDGAGLIAMLFAPSAAAAAPARAAQAPCGTIDDFAALDALPPTTVLVPIDPGPNLLAGSHHATVGGPYHRDPQALEDMLRIFTAEDGTARAIVARRHVRFVAICRGDASLQVMARYAPGGLAARFERSRPVGWLQLVALPGLGRMQLFRVRS